MDEKSLNARMDALDAKLDLVLEYVNQQRLKSAMIEDLVSDFSIIGKDIYDTSVAELENQSIEIDPEQLRMLGLNLVKNIGNINDMLNLFGSVLDLMKDVGPIANEVIIDFTKKLHEFEEKNYFGFFKELADIMDKVITNFSAEDVRQLGDNLVMILQTLKDQTNKKAPQYSLFKVMKEMRTPEMKRAMGFAVSTVKNLASTNDIKS